MGYTKGPWELVIDGGHTPGCGSFPSIVAADGSKISDGNWYGQLTEEESDLRLISAAPDMLEALILCLAQLEEEIMPSSESDAAMTAARTAIARAKGEAE